MNTKTPPVAIDLFAGAGGLAEGLESAGVRVAAAVELHPQAALTHAFNHPHTQVLVGDIRELSMDVLAQALEESSGRKTPDIIVGGPPCQGFSSAGKKVLTDPRNNLFEQFVRIVEYFRPRMFLLENVPGFKHRHQGQAYVQAVTLLADLGYKNIIDAVLDVSGYGVPQRRKRFIMVGWLPDKADPFHWPKPSHGLTNHSNGLFASIAPVVTVSQALSDLAFLEPGCESHRHRIAPLSIFQQERRNGCELLFNHLATRHRQKAVERFSHISEGATVSSVPIHLRNRKKTMARMDRDSVSNAVLAMPDDLIHYERDRIPTVREMARLQSFDDDFVFWGKRTSGFVERRVDVPQYTQVGNAVPPLLGKVLGISLLESLGGTIQDLRDLNKRRIRHHWVLGSSGYAGYVLDQEAETDIIIKTVYGTGLSLPLSTSECRVDESAPLYDWTIRGNPKRGQWAPGVTPRSSPAYAKEATET